MPGVSEELVARAKEVDILSFLLANEPHNIKKSSVNEYCLIDHDSLKISNNMWYWHSRGIGGATALSYLTYVRGVEFTEAVRLLADGQAPLYSDTKSIKQEYKPQELKKPEKLPLKLPVANVNNDRVIAYLRGRGIDRDIITRCVQSGTLYESRQHHNCVFLGRDIGGKIRFACVRGTKDSFRQDMEGSEKRYGFCIPLNDSHGDGVIVTESPVDALSLATLNKLDSPDWDKIAYLSLGGTSSLALVQYLSDHREIKHITLCLDNDKAGRDGAENVMKAVLESDLFSNRALTVSIKPPNEVDGYKDYNDVLRGIINKNKEVINKSRPNRTADSI